MKPEIVVIPLRNRHQILAGSNGIKATGLDDTDTLFPISTDPGTPWTGGN